MTPLVIGLDVGGTKTAIVVESVAGERLVDLQVPSADWDAEPVESGARWVADKIANVLPPYGEVRAIGVGAQGLDTAEVAERFARELARLGCPAIAVNDAALLVPAAGALAGIGVIAGTGAIAVGQDAAGRPMVTGGWGWVIGDEAGAAGIVREATRAALLAHDESQPDDGLLRALLDAFGVGDAERLARAVNDTPTMGNWAPRAGAVFAAASDGSVLARGVLDAAAAHLARLVDQLVTRGAVGADVVVAGGVIGNQPELFEAFRSAVMARHQHLRVTLLTRPPVNGAVALARRLVTLDRNQVPANEGVPR